MTNFETDITIIGAGPVGLFMIFEAGMLKMKCHVVDTLEMIGGQCSALYPEKPIYDIPAHPKISGEDLINALETQAAPFNPTYHLSQQVISLTKEGDVFFVTTSKGTIIKSKAVVIAAGCGAFGPNRPPLDNIEEYEGKSVLYSIRKKSDFNDKNIVIAGGGDSAVDWALSLVDIAKSVSLVHRRNKFKCAPDSHDKLIKLSEEGKINLVVPYQLDSLVGSNGNLAQVIVSDLDGKTVSLDADILLPFFGLSMDLGPILNWDLLFNKHHIEVKQSTLETSTTGVFAIGDVCTYEGKLKLILNGFGECAMAAHAIYNIIYQGKSLHFEYSTTKGIETL